MSFQLFRASISENVYTVTVSFYGQYNIINTQFEPFMMRR